MSFSYGPLADPPTFGPIDSVRLLIADTTEFAADGTTSVFLFSDEEINGAYTIQANQIMPGILGRPRAALPVSPLRVAALLLNSLASNKSRLGNVVKILDVTLGVNQAAKYLRDQAAAYLEQDDNSGGIVIVEQVTTAFAFRDRIFKEFERHCA